MGKKNISLYSNCDMVQCFFDFYRIASDGMLLFETISFQGPVEASAELWERDEGFNNCFRVEYRFFTDF